LKGKLITIPREACGQPKRFLDKATLFGISFSGQKVKEYLVGFSAQRTATACQNLPGVIFILSGA
jgi:hypothetical protein